MLVIVLTLFILKERSPPPRSTEMTTNKACNSQQICNISSYSAITLSSSQPVSKNPIPIHSILIEILPTHKNHNPGHRFIVGGLKLCPFRLAHPSILLLTPRVFLAPLPF